ncbi:MAG: acetylxylan esterase [Isosphaeraceae bacterium]
MSVVLTLFVTAILAQEPPAILPRSAQADRQLHDYLIAEADKAFRARKESVAKLRTAEEVAAYQAEVRRKWIAALGGFPEKTPLNPRVTGTLKRDGYRVEKVIFESRPGHHVTANLYLPEGEGKFPGVLMPIGHSENAKAADYVQKGAILLAKNGIACLAYDPIGQGERKQLLKEDGKSAIGSSTTEHTLIGTGALLVGESAATYRIWDGIRSLDYLASRPEIDASKLGCTGVSGGGTLTSYLMALDDRILAAAPSCYLTTLPRLFATLGPQDAEQNIPGQVALGIDHADYVALRAPKPTLMLASTRDFFDIDGTWTAFREAKQVYGLFGFPERVEIVEINATHGYPKEHREPMARWMARWLLRKDTAIVEPDLPIEPDAELLCTASGQVLGELKGKSCFDLIREKAEALAAARAEKTPTPEELRATVRRLLALPEEIAPARRMELGMEEKDGYTIRRLGYETVPGYTLPAVEFEPQNVDPKTWLVVMVGGMSASKAPGLASAGTLAKRGTRVIKLDLSGLGELSRDPAKSGRPREFGPDVQEAFLAQHLDRPLLGIRARELLAVLAALAPSSPQGIHLIGFDRGALAALHAGALDPNVKIVEANRGVVSWTDVASTPLTNGQFADVVPGVLKSYDLPDLARLIAPRGLVLQDPVDAAGEPIPAEDAAARWKPARAAFEAAGSSATFFISDEAHRRKQSPRP